MYFDVYAELESLEVKVPVGFLHTQRGTLYITTVCQAHKTDFLYTLQYLQHVLFCAQSIVRLFFFNLTCALFAADGNVDEHCAHTVYSVVHCATKESLVLYRKNIYISHCALYLELI